MNIGNNFRSFFSSLTNRSSSSGPAREVNREINSFMNSAKGVQEGKKLNEEQLSKLRDSMTSLGEHVFTLYRHVNNQPTTGKDLGEVIENLQNVEQEGKRMASIFEKSFGKNDTDTKMVNEFVFDLTERVMGIRNGTAVFQKSDDEMQKSLGDAGNKFATSVLQAQEKFQDTRLQEIVASNAKQVGENSEQGGNVKISGEDMAKIDDEISKKFGDQEALIAYLNSKPESENLSKALTKCFSGAKTIGEKAANFALLLTEVEKNHPGMQRLLKAQMEGSKQGRTAANDVDEMHQIFTFKLGSVSPDSFALLTDFFREVSTAITDGSLDNELMMLADRHGENASSIRNQSNEIKKTIKEMTEILNKGNSEGVDTASLERGIEALNKTVKELEENGIAEQNNERLLMVAGTRIDKYKEVFSRYLIGG